MGQKFNPDGTIFLDPNVNQETGDERASSNAIYFEPGQEKLAQDADFIEGGTNSELIKEGCTNDFMSDVIQESERVPVIVDFWAPWCGPCKTLGPILEKLVTQAGGLIKMVKINVDENQELASQMRVQSIPAVYAFQNGQPVDGFAGSVPESQIRAFIDKLLGGAKPPVELAIEQGMNFLVEGDNQGALLIFRKIYSDDPKNTSAIAGLIRTYVSMNDMKEITNIRDNLSPEMRQNAAISSALAAFELAKLGANNQGNPSDVERLKEQVLSYPEDKQARFDFANVLLGLGRNNEAMNELLRIVELDQKWNDNAARDQLLKIFEALGPDSDITQDGRRQLSAILFS